MLHPPVTRTIYRGDMMGFYYKRNKINRGQNTMSSAINLITAFAVLLRSDIYPSFDSVWDTESRQFIDNEPWLIKC